MITVAKETFHPCKAKKERETILSVTSKAMLRNVFEENIKNH